MIGRPGIIQAMGMTDSVLRDFIGAWKLTFIETRDKNGNVFRRGRRTGYLIYSSEGYMSVAFMKKDRPLFVSGDIRGGTVKEKIAAFEGYVSYSGRFELNGEMIRHIIDVSLFPNWVGETQKRLYKLEGDQLTLSTPLMVVGGKLLSTHVIWERV